MRSMKTFLGSRSRVATATLLAAPLLLGSLSFSFSSKSDKKPEISVPKAQNLGQLDGKDFSPFKLQKILPYNHNTNIFVFETNDPKASPNVPTASFILTRTTIGGKEIVRPYTPIDQHEKGVLNLLIKKYEQGNMSKHVHNMKVGDVLDIKGPIVKINYVPNSKSHIGMIAGGTGITPMLQIIDTVLSNPQDKTQVSLVFANIAQEDILLKERLDKLAKEHKNFKVHYVLEKPPSKWNEGVGYVSEQIIKKYMPGPSNKNSMVMVCGPPGMMKAISGEKAPDYSQGKLEGLLAKMNYTSDQVFKF